MRIDFPELGQDQWVEIRDPKWMTWGEKKKIMAFGKDDSIDSQLSIADHIVLSLVTNGHIVPEGQQPIVFPLTEETVNQLPAVVSERVIQEFNKSAVIEKK